MIFFCSGRKRSKPKTSVKICSGVAFDFVFSAASIVMVTFLVAVASRWYYGSKICL